MSKMIKILLTYEQAEIIHNILCDKYIRYTEDEYKDSDVKRKIKVLDIVTDKIQKARNK